MRWLVENWVDALIFTVFAVTVVGIVLFLTGVNPFKPKLPAASPGSPPSAGVVVDQQSFNEQSSSNVSPGSDTQTPSVTVVPLLPTAEQPSENTSNQGQGTTSTAPASVPASSNGAHTAEGQSSIKLPGGPENGIFRVSVGAYKNPENALALAQKLEKQGFPVKLEPVGNVTRVAVGPYKTRSLAGEAARKLIKYDPQVYRGDTPTPEGIYLQVGAYKKLSSAEGLVEKLRSAGIGPIVFYYQEPWLKVWVGPVAPEKVDELKKRLQDLGLQVVEVH